LIYYCNSYIHNDYLLFFLVCVPLCEFCAVAGELSLCSLLLLTVLHAWSIDSYNGISLQMLGVWQWTLQSIIMQTIFIKWRSQYSCMHGNIIRSSLPCKQHLLSACKCMCSTKFRMPSYHCDCDSFLLVLAEQWRLIRTMTLCIAT